MYMQFRDKSKYFQLSDFSFLDSIIIIVLHMILNNTHKNNIEV